MIGSGGLVSRANWTFQTLQQQLRITIPAGSRLPNALALLQRLHADELVLAPEDEAGLRLVADSHRTLWEFFVIANAALRKQSRPDSPFQRELLETAITGADLESQDQNPKARNTQFELYVAALLSLSGAEVIKGEPDLRLLYWGSYVGIAAKRMRSDSPTALAKRVLEGARQIRTHGLEGFVAVNTDVLFVNTHLSEESSQRHQQLSSRNAVINDVVHRRLMVMEQSHVKGVLAFASAYTWDFTRTPAALSSSYPFYYHLITNNANDEERSLEYFEMLAERMSKGVGELLPR